jgi:hypothetical protein
MAEAITKTVDLIEDSLSHLLALSFSKSASPVYPLAVNIAQGAAKYAELEVSRKPVHLVAFAKTRDEAARALALIGYVSGWKTTQVFAGGRLMQRPYTVQQVLDCYLGASACHDRTAHCHRVIDDPYDTQLDLEDAFTIRVSTGPEPPRQRVEIDRYLFPCSLLKDRFRFQVDHPASPEDQIQAGAVRDGCDWCPLFDPRDYGRIGTRVASKAVFA